MAMPPDAAGWRRVIDSVLRGLLVLSGIAALALIVMVAGWEQEPAVLRWIELFARGTLVCFAVAETGRLAVHPDPLRRLRRRWPGLLIALLAAGQAIEFGRVLAWVEVRLPEVSAQALTLLMVALTQAPVIVHTGVRFLRLHEVFAERRLSPGVVMMATFGAMIAVGTLLLKTPRATVDGISWLDAVFTSTSAVCVTGLTVVDTEAAFTPTGRVILLLLIQVGGLGVMTLAVFVAQMFGGVSLRGRVMLQDMISEENLGRIGRTLPLILAMTLVIETAGAIALHAVLDSAQDAGSRVTGWFPAVFHSVSAFCNAGFSTWSGGLNDPAVRANAGLQGIVMVLVVAGGLGFPVVSATARWAVAVVARSFRGKKRRAVLTLHARMVWVTTAVLIAGGAVLIGVAEYGVAGRGHDTPVVVASLFHSITARTVGFNISPVEAFSPAAVLVLILLMFVGGSPGSTAGGVRTTAFAVALLNARRIVLGRRDVEFLGRRIPEELVTRALAVVFLSVVWIAGMSTLLAMIEPGVALSDIVFEVVSAVSTVGLSRGLTPGLSAAGKLLIVLTMFAGRIGVLYFVFAFVRRRESALYRLPEEQVQVA